MLRLQRIIYQSTATLLPDAEVIGSALDDILDTAKTNNTRADLTGALVYSDGVFMQALEGSSHNLDATMDRICKDRRHKQIRILRRDEIDARMFPDEALAFVSSAMIREAVMGSGSGISMDIHRLPAEIFAPLLRSLIVTPAVPDRFALVNRG